MSGGKSVGTMPPEAAVAYGIAKAESLTRRYADTKNTEGQTQIRDEIDQLRR